MRRANCESKRIVMQLVGALDWQTFGQERLSYDRDAYMLTAKWFGQRFAVAKHGEKQWCVVQFDSGLCVGQENKYYPTRQNAIDKFELAMDDFRHRHGYEKVATHIKDQIDKYGKIN